MVEEDAPLLEASALMEEKKIRYLGVTEGGKIRGILSVKDFEKWWTDWK